MTKGERAKEIFLTGRNCSQSVVLAFKEELGLDENTLLKLSIGLGGGIGRLRLTCGAVTGMVIALSYLLSDGNDRASIYPTVQRACKEFEKELGSLTCAELLNGVKVDGTAIPEKRTEEYYKKRPCAEICQIAADIAEKIIKSKI